MFASGELKYLWPFGPTPWAPKNKINNKNAPRLSCAAPADRLCFGGSRIGGHTETDERPETETDGVLAEFFKRQQNTDKTR